ncbi:hypothetical protein THASP1DRAFT_29759 [Thamnocephalis sphaerospora]|uniref:Uncharacterized protein n=1 Tax=Thamnocephalis sphaerospora TaxID=78915 RepID=A0A4P9XQW7_9FUNG|nr:hypothetical protein THASP1DRAFT_29759 [Thamnocephalis sphaerospora]|eukprot:RKP08438.1 hypothetical protein THASP1DRAFT_29759 [Thamnocephalis sphaerospora]
MVWRQEAYRGDILHRQIDQEPAPVSGHLSIRIAVTRADLNAKVLHALLSCQPYGRLGNNQLQMALPLIVGVYPTSIRLRANVTPDSREAPLLFTNGNTRDYPFDHYSVIVPVYVDVDPEFFANVSKPQAGRALRTAGFARRSRIRQPSDRPEELPTSDNALTQFLPAEQQHRMPRLLSRQAVAAPASASDSTPPVDLITPNRSVPFRVTFTASVQSLKFSYVFSGRQDDTYYLLVLEMSRNTTVIGLSIFLTIVMWCLTLAMAHITLQFTVFQREPPPPLVPIGLIVLFAMPGLRNVQPGIPATGCAIDFLGFTWQVAAI